MSKVKSKILIKIKEYILTLRPRDPHIHKAVDFRKKTSVIEEIRKTSGKQLIPKLQSRDRGHEADLKSLKKR